MKKLAVIFTVVMLYTFSLGDVHANEQVIAVEDNNPLIIDINEDVINQKEKENFSKSVADFENENSIDTRALVSKTTLVSTKTLKEAEIGWAGGQPKNGTNFGGPGSICWTDGGNNENVSLNFGYGPISFSISKGNVAGSSAMCKDLISSQYYRDVKLYIRKDIQVKTYAYYTKDAMALESAWSFQGYIHSNTSTRNILEIRLV